MKGGSGNEWLSPERLNTGDVISIRESIDPLRPIFARPGMASSPESEADPPPPPPFPGEGPVRPTFRANFKEGSEGWR